MERVNEINQKVRELQRRMASVTQDESWLEVFVEEVEAAACTLFEMDGVTLRQVVSRVDRSDEMLIKQATNDLARMYNHVQEDQEIIEDFLDYKRDYYIHQVSLCPKTTISSESIEGSQGSTTIPSYGDFTFVLQVKVPYQLNNMPVGGLQSPTPAVNLDNSAMSMNQNPLAGLNSILTPN